LNVNGANINGFLEVIIDLRRVQIVGHRIGKQRGEIKMKWIINKDSYFFIGTVGELRKTVDERNEFEEV
jgi:hypothetical protein